MIEHIDLVNLLPLIIIAGTAIVLMLMIAVKRIHWLSMLITLLGFLAAFISLTLIPAEVPSKTPGLLLMDTYSLFFNGLILFGGMITTLLSFDYFKDYSENPEEFYILICLAILGAGVLVSSRHFATLFLGYELLSISLYVMVAYVRYRKLSIEAGAKYLILAAVSSAFLLFGMALVYTALGEMHFSALFISLSDLARLSWLTQLGLALMMGGISFKLALVPFHLWTPDVYQGAPAPVTGFVATISKGSVFAILFKLYGVLGLYDFQFMTTFFILLAIASMFAGNLLALLQKNVKRLLAYSSIAHLGYLLIAFIAGRNLGGEAAGYYLLGYFITMLGAFGVISILSHKHEEVEEIHDFRGLFWKNPWIGLILSAMLFSLAGIPLTAGFIGKFYLATAGLWANQMALVIILIVNSVIGLYYYLRIVVAMFSKPTKKHFPFTTSHHALPETSLAVLFLLLILLVWFGIFPQGMAELIQHCVQI